MQLPTAAYPGGKEITDFQRLALERLEALPGVASASLSYSMPFFGLAEPRRYLVAGRETPQPGHEPSAAINGVSPHYFETVGTHLISGRTFSRPSAIIRSIYQYLLNQLKKNKDVYDVALGAGLGYKLVTKKGFVFEANAGYGKLLFNANKTAHTTPPSNSPSLDSDNDGIPDAARTAFVLGVRAQEGEGIRVFHPGARERARPGNTALDDGHGSLLDQAPKRRDEVAAAAEIRSTNSDAALLVRIILFSVA
jgi:hypothetical protein